MSFVHRWRLGIIALLALALTAIAPLGSASAAAGSRCFAETGFCISGDIRAYWERNGGLSVFGYPISDLHNETVETWTGPTQWFQRDRLEDHANEGKGVLAGRLGAEFLAAQGRTWQPGNDGPQPARNLCTRFPQTGYNMCAPFSSYWSQNGGLERFGYPITPPAMETIEGRPYLVQYFERRRMEYHPENAGTPYEILLGLLGRDLYRPLPAGGQDILGGEQQAILDATWAALRPQFGSTPLAIGLIDVSGDYAAVLAAPKGQLLTYVFLKSQSLNWQVMEITTSPSADLLRQRGIPERLGQATDAYQVVKGALAQLQDPRGNGMNAYVTHPRISGDFARFWVAPAASEQLDTVTMFFQRKNGAWSFLTAGSAFPEEDLRALGVPQDLWPYGESVSGPA